MEPARAFESFTKFRSTDDSDEEAPTAAAMCAEREPVVCEAKAATSSHMDTEMGRQPKGRVRGRRGKRSGRGGSKKRQKRPHVGISANQKQLWRRLHAKMEQREFVDAVCRLLREPKRHLISAVVADVGRPLAMQIMNETQERIEAGGMRRADGKGFRTRGGVFLTILRKHISLDDYKALVKQSRRKMKSHRTEREEAQIAEVGRQLMQKTETAALFLGGGESAANSIAPALDGNIEGAGCVERDQMAQVEEPLVLPDKASVVLSRPRPGRSRWRRSV